ncbi:MAG: hypothetical protein JK586_00685 [Nocardiopsis sp. BM-2018]|uniref:Uncharacterized protein n=1 Tax=Nocardiopsis metallicus TaxID=179819 RepID=A0A840W4H1_9ACTN|nr:hypothetical protein [Nocardiopsis metallicus]MBB5491829.1 hypothetical protein [Nocardiopsis metallicus]QRN80228.1 MAG: hypothetical protein JK586_00685 [Nocardiopsis sp. BM-2018]
MDERQEWDRLVRELAEGTEMTVDTGGIGTPVTYRATSRAEVLPGERGIRISCFKGLELEEPMVLHLDPPTLAARLRDLVEDAVAAFGTRREGGLVAARALFMVHLQETVETARPGEVHLVPARGGFDSLREPPP